MRIPLRYLILTTIILSLVAAVVPLLQAYLTLSWAVVKNLYIWQLVTYIFIERNLTWVGLLFQLAFNMYLLWLFGTPLLDFARPRLFFALYFGSALVSALSVLLLEGSLAGSMTAVYAVMVAWMMIHQGSQLMLFFALPFKAEWLIIGMIGITLFIDISGGYWASAISLIASVIYAYFFTLIAWRQVGPFSALRSLEQKVLRLLEPKRPPYRHTKIYDIKSGEPVLSDDQFMDAMLDKISRLGEDSLSPEEKKRMNAVSKRKSKF